MVRVVTVLLVMLTLLPSVAQAEKRIALLIGNKDYKPGVGALVNPLNDVRMVGEALKTVGFDVLEPVHNATRTAILLAIHEFAAKLQAAGPDAVGFLYYSGHGIASLGENYLIPVDVDEPSTRLLRIAGVKQTEVQTILRTEAPNAAHYVVLDACRNTLKGTRGNKGFEAVPREDGVLVAYAAAAGKTASDRGDNSGPYAAALAAELVKPGQNDLIMFHQVRMAVRDKTNGDQVPWTEDGIQRRERVMFGAPVMPPRQPNPDTPRILPECERYWEKIKHGTQIEILEDYIRRCGDTFHGVIARVQLARAKDIAEQQRLALLKEEEAERKRAQAVKLTGLGPTFRDCPDCPEMVVIPEGGFMMGSEEKGDEKPPHKVTINAPFAAGKFEVTFAEWDACVSDGGCRHKPDDRGWGRGTHPVINVSWYHITREYLPWLSRKSGKAYRLLTEAEWEYAARGVTSPTAAHTRYSWGDGIGTNRANCNGCGSQWDNKQTAPVGPFPANIFGLHDMHGNVGEWVADCWNDNYQDVPADGSALTTGDCSRRVLRGGAWIANPRSLRAASRDQDVPFSQGTDDGFRVARSLD